MSVPATDSAQDTEVSRLKGTASDSLQASTSATSGPAGCAQQIGTAIVRVVWHTGLGATLTASVAVSLNAVAIKYLGQPGHNVVVMEIVAVRGAVCVLLALLVGASGGLQNLRSKRRNWPYLAVRGISGSTSMVLYLVAVMNLPLADAITLFFFNPTMTVILAWACLGEPLLPLAMAGIACSLVGVVVVAKPPFIFGGHETWNHKRVAGVCCGLLASLTSSIAFVAIRKIQRAESALAVATWFYVSQFVMGAFALLIGVPDPATLPTTADWLLMLAVAVTSFCGQLVVGRAYQIEVASKVAAVSYIQVLNAFLAGLLLFGESLSLLSILGSLLIAGGIVTSSSSKPKSDKTSVDEEAQELAHAPLGPGPPASKIMPSVEGGDSQPQMPDQAGDDQQPGQLDVHAYKQQQEAESAAEGSDDDGDAAPDGDAKPLLHAQQS